MGIKTIHQRYFQNLFALKQRYHCMLQFSDSDVICYRYSDHIRKKPAEIKGAVSGKGSKVCKRNLFLNMCVNVGKNMIVNIAAVFVMRSKMAKPKTCRQY